VDITIPFYAAIAILALLVILIVYLLIRLRRALAVSGRQQLKTADGVIADKPQEDGTGITEDLQFRSIVEIAADGIVYCNEDGAIMEWNKAMEHLTGLSRSEMVGQPIWNVVNHEPGIMTYETFDDAPVVTLKYFDSQKYINGSVINEGILYDGNGGKKYIEVSQSKLKTESGINTLHVVRDVTERKGIEFGVVSLNNHIMDFLNNISDLVQRTTPEGDVLYVNRKWMECLKYDTPEVKRMNILEVIHEDYHDQWMQERARLLKGESVDKIFLVLRGKDGAEIAVEGNIEPQYENERVVSFRGIFADVSDKLIALNELKKSEQTYMDLYDNAPDMYFTVDPKGGVVSVNKYGAEYLGYSKHELINEPVWKVIHPEDLKQVKRQIGEIIKGKRLQSRLEFRKVRKDGSVVFVNESVKLVLNEDNSVRELRILCTDKTDQLMAILALKDSEQKYRTLIEQSNDAIYLIFNDKFEIINKKFEKLLGYSQEEVIAPGFDIMDMVAPVSRDMVRERREQMKKNGDHGARYEFTALTKEDVEIDVEVSVSHVKYRGGTAVQGVLRNITERKKMEQALRDGQEHFRSVFEGARDAILVESPEGEIYDVNRSACEMFGYERDEFIGMNVRDILPSDMLKHLPELKKIHKTGGSIFLREGENLHRNGRKIPVEVSTSVINVGDNSRVVAIIRDISERKDVEKEKLEAIRKTVSALAKAVELRDPYTYGHSYNVAQIAEKVAQRLGWDNERILGLRLAAELHDIGKIAIPAEILSKPARLSELEYSIVKEHAMKGYEILKDIKFPFPTADAVHQHHELLDGSGYPKGLKGEEIIMEARIIGVADILETFTSHRPYRPAFGVKKAVEKLKTEAGVLYDKQVIDVVLKLLNETKGKPFWQNKNGFK
jgi:PAS domain S-box-containing protein/putative nucleotidyltransferase with HDIG domain